MCSCNLVTESYVTSFISKSSFCIVSQIHTKRHCVSSGYITSLVLWVMAKLSAGNEGWVATWIFNWLLNEWISVPWLIWSTWKWSTAAEALTKDPSTQTLIWCYFFAGTQAATDRYSSCGMCCQLFGKNSTSHSSRLCRQEAPVHRTPQHFCKIMSVLSAASAISSKSINK